LKNVNARELCECPTLGKEIRRNIDNRVAMTLDNEVKTSKFNHHERAKACIDLDSIPFSLETKQKKVDQIIFLYICHQMSKIRDDLYIIFKVTNDTQVSVPISN
jgi:hypothetical protein